MAVLQEPNVKLHIHKIRLTVSYSCGVHKNLLAFDKNHRSSVMPLQCKHCPFGARVQHQVDNDLFCFNIPQVTLGGLQQQFNKAT